MGEEDRDQKGVEEMSELVVRVSFVGFCSPCVWGLSGCRTVCAWSVIVLWSCCAIDQSCSPGRSRADSTSSLSPPSRPIIVNPQHKNGRLEMDYLFSWRSLDDSRLCCVVGEEVEEEEEDVWGLNFVGPLCWVADVDVEEDDDDCCWRGFLFCIEAVAIIEDRWEYLCLCLGNKKNPKIQKIQKMSRSSNSTHEI